MNRKEAERCAHYHAELARDRARLAELEERGSEALSRYDVEVAHQGNAQHALEVALYLKRNHVRHDLRQLETCPEEMFSMLAAAPEPSIYTTPPKTAQESPIARQVVLFELPS